MVGLALAVSCRLASRRSPALGGDAAHFLHVGLVRVEVAQVEAVDVAIGHVDGADPLGRRRLAVSSSLVVLGGRRLELAFAVVALDAVAVEQPERGPRKQPGQHDHVAA